MTGLVARDLLRLRWLGSPRISPDAERVAFIEFTLSTGVDRARSRDTGGTGLGLSIVRHVANNHQGWVDVESREGDGSTFSLVLPLQGERIV